MKVQYRVAIGAVAVAAGIFFFRWLVGGSTISLFAPQGTVAAGEVGVIKTAVLLMLIVVIPVYILLYTFAWRYRADNVKAKYDPEQTHKPWKELLLWLVPISIVAMIAVLTWRSAHALDPYTPIQSPNPPITIQVVSLEWKWLFIYPAQNIATVNFIQFPVNTPVHFELTADSPMSSFWIPQLGSQIYAMAAMETQLNLIASTIGEFTGKDTEINGDGYAGMTFTAKSSSQSDFDAWVASVRQSSPPLTEAAYNALALPSQNNPPAYYSSVEGDMFDGIMMKFMMPSGTPMSSSSQTMPGMDMMPGMHM